MNKKSGANTGAVIEIGAGNVTMRVSQLYKGNITTLDYLKYPVRLGHDVFDSGYATFESVRELSGALSKFSEALNTYRVQKTCVISCSALRDAQNKSLVTDQLKVRNGIDIQILEDSQEKAYLYSEITAMLSAGNYLKEGNSVIAYVGSGSIGIAVYDGSSIVTFQNISMGALKLNDILSGMRRTTVDFHVVVEEYLDTILNRVSLLETPAKNLILCGSQIDMVASLCGAKCDNGVYRFEIQKLTELYKSLRSFTPGNVAIRYGITESEAALFYVSLAIYHSMLRFASAAKTVYCPSADISSAVTRCMLIPKAESERLSYCRASAIACAETTACRFGCDKKHYDFIRQTSVQIFDKMKKVHGLDPSKKIILELASILHSCGNIVSVRQHNMCTFDLIKGMDLFGLSEMEVLETAFVAGSISNNLAVDENPDFSRLSVEEKLTVSKLAAMFRIANALDKAHSGKLGNLKISVEADRVLFKAVSNRDTLLEQWSFAESAQFFKDVFGLSPELSVKFQLL